MKRRRPEPVQGSMLTLMGVREPPAPFSHSVIIRESRDEADNVLEVSTEPVPSDEEEDEARWSAYSCPTLKG